MQMHTIMCARAATNADACFGRMKITSIFANFSKKPATDLISKFMYLLYENGFSLRDIANVYGVSSSAISQNARRFSAGKEDMEKLELILSNVKR